MEAQALHKRGWTISAIARHLERDRKTIRGYLTGTTTPGTRRRVTADPFEPFLSYITQRLTDDSHVWATTLFDELIELGYPGSYQSFTRAVRLRGLRPPCPACQAPGRDRAIIDHPPGEETQFDWLELPDPPRQWGLTGDAHLLVGSLAHSSKWRAMLAESEDQPHLVEALDGVVRELGGVSLRWRFDRMATVATPRTGMVSASFAQVAKHYGAAVMICPSHRGRRKGVVEKANHSAAQRWWRTLADTASMAEAQSRLDAFCARVGDARTRKRDGVLLTVAALADAEPLLAPPSMAYPAVLSVERTVSDQALCAFRGNFYSVPPGLAGTIVTVRARLGEAHLDLVSPRGAVLARHPRRPNGAGAVQRDDGHVAALERIVLAGSSAERAPCRHKVRRPLSPAALEEAAQLRGVASSPGEHVVVDFAPYLAAFGGAQTDKHCRPGALDPGTATVTEAGTEAVPEAGEPR